MFAPRQPKPRENPHPSTPIYPKLEVSAKNDPQEKEADAVADSVMQQSETAAPTEEEKVQGKVSRDTVSRLLQRSADAPRAHIPRGPVLFAQRKEEDENIMRDHDAEEENVMRDHDGEAEKDNIMPTPESQMPMLRDEEERVQPIQDEEEPVKRSAKNSVGEKGGAAPESVTQGIQASKGQGNPLPENVQHDIGGKMGADLSDVRIHTGSNAHDMSTAIHAKAFTHGQDIYFRNGNYDPNTNAGKKLLAHELTHTQQQSARGGGGVNRKVQRSFMEKAVMGAWNMIRLELAFKGGLIAGFFESILDAIVAPYQELYSVLSGEYKELMEALRKMTWKELWEKIKDGASERVSAYWKKMSSPDPWTSGYAGGWLTGYIVADLLMGLLSGGELAGLKWGSRLMSAARSMVPKVVKIAKKGTKKIKKTWKKKFRFNSGKIPLPKGWVVKPSQKGGGTIFQDPLNPHNSIRQMPGNPNSLMSAQHKPYVIFKKNGVAYDVDGKPLKSATGPAAHIPLHQFDISKMPTF